jgi:predicted transcriptional regulator with HTH domain
MAERTIYAAGLSESMRGILLMLHTIDPFTNYLSEGSHIVQARNEPEVSSPAETEMLGFAFSISYSFAILSCY